MTVTEIFDCNCDRGVKQPKTLPARLHIRKICGTMSASFTTLQITGNICDMPCMNQFSQMQTSNAYSKRLVDRVQEKTPPNRRMQQTPGSQHEESRNSKALRRCNSALQGRLVSCQVISDDAQRIQFIRMLRVRSYLRTAC